MVDCSASAALRTRQRSIKGVKLGAAIMAMTARMETVTISSMRVKPCCLRGSTGYFNIWAECRGLLPLWLLGQDERCVVRDKWLHWREVVWKKNM